MAKKHTVKKDNVKQQRINAKPLIKEQYQDIFFIILLALSVYIFFGSAIFGNGFYVSDNLASHSFETYLEDASNDGAFPQWIPYIFSGMPSFAALLTTGVRAWAFLQTIFFNIVGFVGTLFGSDVARLAFYYVIYGVGIYILMRSKDHERFVSFFTSMAAVFSTCVIVWIMIGHNTKPVVFAMFPFVILLLERLRQKFSLINTILLILVVHIMMEAGHIQMIFYGISLFAIYLIFEFMSRLIAKKEPLKVIRSAGLLAIAGGMAFLMSADRYLSTIEYTPHSTRGKGPIVMEESSEQTASGGHDYDYATMWSYSPEEMMLFLVPNYFGFGKLDYSGPATRGEDVKVPSYWGQKPFDDAAAYMGIIVFGLAIAGFIMYKHDVFVQFLFVASIFSLALSFGKNLPVIYDFFYYYVPSFNKFRAPSMALAILQFAAPILAGYGLSGFLRLRKEKNEKNIKVLKGFLISSFVFLAIGFLFSLAFKSVYIGAVSESGNSSFQSYIKQIPDFAEFIYNKMISDWMIGGAIFVIASLFLYYYVKGKISKSALFISLIILLVADLWRVDYRAMEVSDKAIETGAFAKTDIIQFLQQDISNYRIADMARRDTPNGMAYFGIENVNGYHSAKLRVYQDLMDVANLPQALGSTSTLFNPFIWNMLNVKYIVSSGKLWEDLPPAYQSQQTGELVYYNTGALPRVFFVDSAAVETPIKILHHLRDGDFDPEEVAYFEDEIPNNFNPRDSMAKAEITEQKNEYIRIETSTRDAKLLFIGEIYYPAWKAYVDGKETKIYKTNYICRSIVVPGGKHSIELKYESLGFDTGRNLSLASNIAVAILLILGIFIEMRKSKQSRNL